MACPRARPWATALAEPLSASSVTLASAAAAGALGLVWGCFGGGLLAACGGDDASSSGGTPYASTDTGNNVNPDGSTGPTAPTIVASDSTIYTGMTAVLDASGTQAQTFAWTVKTLVYSWFGE